MSSFTRHAYSSRARIGKAQAKVALAAARTSDQDILDQNDPSPDDRRLSSDAAAGRKTPRLRGGHESVGNSSEGGESPGVPKTLMPRGVMIKKIKLRIRI